LIRAVRQTNKNRDRHTDTDKDTQTDRYDAIICHFSQFYKGFCKLESEFLRSVDMHLIGEYSLHSKLLLECNTASEICVVLEFYAT